MPTPSPTVLPTADPDAIEAFIEELGSAIAEGRSRFMFRNLHPAVLERYGAPSCRAYTSNSSIAGLQLDYVDAFGPESWDWILDELTTNISDAWTVTVRWRQPGVDEAREIHIAPADATWRWFTDCGDPLG